MVEFEGAGIIDAHRSALNQRIVDSYVNAPSKTVEVIAKSEFCEKFPEDQYAFYTVKQLDKFRNDLKASIVEKGEGADNSDQMFRDLTKDLERYLVTDSGKGAIIFVAKKVQG